MNTVLLGVLTRPALRTSSQLKEEDSVASKSEDAGVSTPEDPLRSRAFENHGPNAIGWFVASGSLDGVPSGGKGARNMRVACTQDVTNESSRCMNLSLKHTKFERNEMQTAGAGGGEEGAVL